MSYFFQDFVLIPEDLIPYASQYAFVTESPGENAVIIGAETASATSKALQLQHAADPKFKRPIKAHQGHACEWWYQLVSLILYPLVWFHFKYSLLP